ncbi:hypothetical protein Cst_c18010 [Thermoclostridium stercorarium subsp. stercorarium DSM 8532]|uniref:Uncharacterized protein n=1 Tax=Thermoclostridium stercorarium (strain ATCC 35414 / DSM 8532 / NCIMB 11754) TaxID=1121335 RepID=L7VQW3_THES1|nr:hypothetical protein Cst_c18010 [Thermoclostridium stercorarium subsp. stercorarium DSM 8532]
MQYKNVICFSLFGFYHLFIHMNFYKKLKPVIYQDFPEHSRV